MSIVSYKNLLQELCHKRKINQPKYSRERIGGPDHKPLWRVSLNLNNDTWYVTCDSIPNGEQSLAKNICEQFEEKIVEVCNTDSVKSNTNPIVYNTLDEILVSIEKINTTFIKPSKGIVFVDYENVNLSDSDVAKYSNYLFILISAKNCNKPLFSNSNTLNIVCNFIGRDVADTMLICLSGILYENMIDKEKYIFTRDHYGDGAARILNGKHICNLNEI
jgi:hypothetical protein